MIEDGGLVIEDGDWGQGLRTGASAYFSNQCNQIDTVSAPREGADYKYKYSKTVTRNTRLRERENGRNT